MWPTTLRWQLVFLTFGNLLCFAAFAALAAWVIDPGGLPPSEAAAVLVTLCALLGLGLPVVFTVRYARRISESIVSLAALGKTLVSGAPADAPRPGLREVALVHGELARGVGVVRGREASLRAADRAKDEFLAMLSHELRNPLSAQVAAAHVLLRRCVDDAKTAHAAGVIARQVEQMTRLVEDLLDVTRVTRGKVSLSRQPLDLARQVEAAAQALRDASRLRGHALALDLAEVWVHGDEARLQQIVCNLIGNAIKYTPEGGSIAITLRRDRDSAVLRVRDNGVGMAPDLAARVFDLFVQGEDETRQAVGGLGIGLALVRHLAELHGGKAFAASSGPGEGSVFTITLPAIEAPAAQAAGTVAAAGHPRHRIVLVEDNADARSTLFEALELDGHRVYEAADGSSGIRTIAALKPDVAIIDIGLPDLSGFDVAASLREHPERRNMVLIALTGREQPDSLRRAREAGFDEYVTKPIAPERLLRLIEAVFSRTRMAA